MKLYVWNDEYTLCDYTHGMICAIGVDLEDALKAVERACDYCMNSFPNHKPTKVIDLGENCPAQPEAWVCYGGG